jgi:hypothetical protein
VCEIVTSDVVRNRPYGAKAEMKGKSVANTLGRIPECAETT